MAYRRSTFLGKCSFGNLGDELGIQMTPNQFKQIFPSNRDPTNWSNILNAVSVEFEITTPARLVAWLAQCGHESAQFRHLRECMSYSAVTMMNTWPSRFRDLAHAQQYARQPEKLANYVYALRLGNGPPETGDGWRYRGGGVIQLTGKTQYKLAGEAIGVPLESTPNKIEQPLTAARVAGWYWKDHGLNELADVGEFDRITETINGPAKLGLAERKMIWEKAKQVLGG